MKTKITIGSVVASVGERLGGESRTQARWIVARATGLGTTELTSSSDRAIDAAAADRVEAMLQRIEAGEPLQYVLGSWSFREMELAVDSRVLVPRPETEQLVDVALDELTRFAKSDGEVGDGRRREPSSVTAVDLGTGSGAIALSLAVEGSRALRAIEAEDRRSRSRRLEVWATDDSDGALDVVALNVEALRRLDAASARVVQVRKGSWFEALPSELRGSVALVVSNPPYVSAAQWRELEPVVRDHEPRGALVPGESGLEDLEHLVDAAPLWLCPGGAIVLEHAPGQTEALVRAAKRTGAYSETLSLDDLAGRPRFLVARRNVA